MRVDVNISVRSLGPVSENVEVEAAGSLPAALRACILRLAERYGAEPDMIDLAEAVARVEVGK